MLAHHFENEGILCGYAKLVPCGDFDINDSIETALRNGYYPAAAYAFAEQHAEVGRLGGVLFDAAREVYTGIRSGCREQQTCFA